MKKLFYFTTIVAGLCGIAASCNKEQNIEEERPVGPTIEHEVQIIAGKPTTKTVIEDAETPGEYDVLWEITDKIALFQKIDDEYKTKRSSTNISINADTKTATFTISLTEDTQKTDPVYKYVAVSPTNSATRSGDALLLTIPSAQTLLDGTFDPEADVLVSNIVTRQPFSSDALTLNFGRAGATARMVLKGLTAGEKVKSVTFSTTENKNIAGVLNYSLATEKITSVSSGKKSISISSEDGIDVPSGGEFVVWFRTVEVTLTDNFTVTALTEDSDSHVIEYTKTVDLSSSSKTIEFQDSYLTKFAVSNLTRTDRGSSSTYAELVTTASTPLAAEDQILIVGSSSNNTQALGTTQNSNNRSTVEVTVNNENKITTIPTGAQIIVLETATKQNDDNSYWALNVGGDNDAYLYAASSSSNYLRTQTTNDDNGKWLITIDGQNVATITAQGTNTHNLLKYNPGSSIFSCYASGQNDVKIYRIVGGRKKAKLSFSASSYEVTLGDATTGKPTLNNPNSLTVTYSSNNTDVVAVDEGTGALTLVGAGTATITASSAETTEYEAGSASYTITVNKKESTLSFTNENYILLRGSSDYNSFTGQSVTNELSLSPITYTSDNSSLYTVANDGVVTRQSGAVGKATITASFAGNDEYAPANATYNIYVPYSPAEANAAATNTEVSNQYVFGIVESLSGTKNFYISADGTDNNSFYIYWNKTTGRPSEGDEVLLKGSLNTYSTAQLKSPTIVLNNAAEGTVATPTFAPDASEITLDTGITISCETEGATIYYTTNGYAPSSASTLYTGAITITGAKTIKAIAVKKGMKKNSAQASYTISKVATPTFSVTTGSVSDGIVEIGATVSISCETEGATIYYSTDGGENWTAGNSVTITEDTILSAKATKSNYLDSNVDDATYEIAQVATPTFTVAEGAVEIGTIVNIECATEGADIYYNTELDTYPAGTWTKGSSITITEETYLQAIAIKDKWTNSALTGPVTYSIKKVATPTMETDGGFVTLACTTVGATIYYKVSDDTIDNPAIDTSAGWVAYTNPFELTANKYIYVAARKANWLDSDVLDDIYEAPASVFTITGTAITTANNQTILTLGNKAGAEGKKSFSIESNYSWEVSTSVEAGITPANLTVSGANAQTKGDGTLEVSYSVANETNNDIDLGTITLTDAIGGTQVIYIKQAAKSSDPKTSTLTFTAACGGSGTADDGTVWTVTSDGTESTYDATKGIHYGTGSAEVKYITLTTSDITGTISKVVVNASTASGVSATVGVTVGGNAFGGDPKSLTTSAANYSFEGSASGEIVVTVTKPSKAAKALYVKSIEVTYN